MGVELIQFPGSDRLESASPYCVKVQRLLRYKGIPFTVRSVNLPPRRALNPAGKLPVLVWDGDVIPDSSRIAREVERRRPEPTLVPADPAAAALSHLLEDWADEALYWMLLYLRWRLPANAARMKAVFAAGMGFPLSLVGPTIVARAIGRQLQAQGVGRLGWEAFLDEQRRTLASLDALVAGGGFLCGAAPAVADLAVFAMLQGIRDAPLVERGVPLDDSVHLARWYARVDDLTRRG